MQIKSIWVSSLLTCLIFLGCNRQQKELPPKEYVNWVRDEANGLRKKKQISEYVFTVQYKPVNYILALQMLKGELTKDSFETRKQELMGLQYYDMTIDVIGSNQPVLEYQVSSQSEYQERLNYFMFLMQNDVYLEEAGRKLPCQLYHLERTFHLTKHSTFLLAFDQNNAFSDSAKTLVVNCDVLNIGPVRTTFDEHKIKYIPAVKL